MRETGIYGVREIDIAMTLACRDLFEWKLSRYIRKIQESGMALETLKKIIIGHISQKEDSFFYSMLWHNYRKSKQKKKRVHKNISKAVTNIAFKDVTRLREYIEATDLKRWKKSMINAVKGAKSYDDMADLYTDNGMYEPLIWAYVNHAIQEEIK